MNTAVNDNYDEIYLCLSSIGGTLQDGFYLYNHIRGLTRLRVSIHNTGTVASVAVVTFVAGQRRICSPNGVFMMHPVMISAQGQTTQALSAAFQSALAEEQRIEAVLRERTQMPAELLAARRQGDVYLAPQRALEVGLIDEIGDFVLPRGDRILQIV